MTISGLIFLGPPGAGKGTQAAILAANFNIPHISTGEILRNAIASQTPLGQKAQSYVDKGELVPDDLILDLISHRLKENDAQKGWILDGFPRNVTQARFLDQLLAQIHQVCGCTLSLQVPDEILIKRLVLRGRKDDNESIIRHRLQVHHEQTEPLIVYYKQKGILYSVNGDRPPEEVTASLNAIVQEKLNN